MFFLCCSEQHFTEVMLGEEFMGLSLQQVCSLISSDKLTVSTEEKVTIISVFHSQPLSHQYNVDCLLLPISNQIQRPL